MSETSPTIDLGPRQVGRQVLGPVFAEFFMRLHAFSRSHDPEARRLFVARAGVRLQRLYHVFCEARGLQPAESEILWTSRLLAAKALYGLDDELFYRAVHQEFRKGSIQAFGRAMSRHREPLRLGPLRKRPIAELRELLESGQMPRLHAFLTAEAELARSYLRGALGEPGQQTFLIDSGWHGTIHRLLLPLADSELTSLLVARVRREGEEAPPENQLVGLVLEADRFDIAVPESSLVFHRHLIEAPLEPLTPSIERVVRADDGSFIFPEAAGSARVDESLAKDLMFLGIEDHLRSHGDERPFQLQSAFVEAIDQLAQAILHPRLADLHSLDMGLRSSDFGRDYAAPILMEPVPRRAGDSAELRIRDSLWPQGQALVELGEQGAKNVHRSLAGGLTDADYFHPWRQTRTAEATGTVAVVTRTKDRPILLRRAADSVARQVYADFHWVVVNDGGELDPVLEVIRSSAVPRSTITIVSNASSVGMEAASNLGAGAVDSAYLAVHDDDDSWDPRFLSECVRFLCERGDEYVGVVTETTYVSEEIVDGEVVVRELRPYNPTLRAISLAEMATGNLFAPIAFLFTRQVFDKAGGFAENLPVLGDWDFNLRVLAQGDIGFLPKPLAFYHHRDVSSTIGYGNSVIAGRDKHLEFDVKVRNEYLRRVGEGDALGHIALVGQSMRTLREEIRQIKRSVARSSSPTPVGSADPDLLWWALAALLRRQQAAPPRGRFRQSQRRPQVQPLTSELVSQLVGELPAGEVPPPPDFDEAKYLRQNPDVKKAVRTGHRHLTSGWEHYLLFGKAEGRSRPTRRK